MAWASPLSWRTGRPGRKPTAPISSILTISPTPSPIRCRPRAPCLPTRRRRRRRNNPRGPTPGLAIRTTFPPRIAAPSPARWSSMMRTIPTPPLPTCGWAWSSNRRSATGCMIFRSGAKPMNSGPGATPAATSSSPMSCPAPITPCMPSGPARRARSCRKIKPGAIRRGCIICRPPRSASRSPAGRRTIWGGSPGRPRGSDRRCLRLVIPTGPAANFATGMTGLWAPPARVPPRPAPSGPSSWIIRSIIRTD